MSTDKVDNKREFDRVQRKCPALVQVFSEGEEDIAEELNGLTEDVSKGGMKLETFSELSVGTIMNIRISLEEDISHDLVRKGIVLWSREKGPDQFEVGIEFTGQPDPHESIWNDYIDKKTGT